MIREPMLQFFEFKHLKPELQKFSKPFWVLAHHMCNILPRNPERTAGLRNLLLAKDCAIRAYLYDEHAGEVMTKPPSDFALETTNGGQGQQGHGGVPTPSDGP